jgi:hypothetical protein
MIAQSRIGQGWVLLSPGVEVGVRGVDTFIPRHGGGGERGCP